MRTLGFLRLFHGFYRFPTVQAKVIFPWQKPNPATRTAAKLEKIFLRIHDTETIRRDG